MSAPVQARSTQLLIDLPFAGEPELEAIADALEALAPGIGSYTRLLWSPLPEGPDSPGCRLVLRAAQRKWRTAQFIVELPSNASQELVVALMQTAQAAVPNTAAAAYLRTTLVAALV